MRIIRAREMGLCFGVRDALEIAQSEPEPSRTTIHGELVHNEAVLADLRARGFGMHAERARGGDGGPSRSKVLITAHGVSDSERARLVAGGAEIIDTTCPLVARAHAVALALAGDGRHVVIIGKPDHVEVRGLVGDLARYDVVRGPEDVREYSHPRLGVLCQTTCPESLARATVAAIEALNPFADVRFIDTICEPTKLRVRAVVELAREADCVVVVGGRNSNNTKQLAALCAGEGTPAFHVQGESDLRAEWFADCEVVGLTAGTSTPDAVIDGVHAALAEL